jgi:hypothetical protein
VYITPGQFGGCLGAKYDPFVLNADPNARDYQPAFGGKDPADTARLGLRHDLLARLDSSPRRNPARVREVHLAFDTGLHRALTLTLQDSYNAGFIHRVQPETVRDYELQLIDGERHETVAKVTGNYQRKCIHRFDSPIPASGLRLVVTATNGDKSARVFEVRAYA